MKKTTMTMTLMLVCGLLALTACHAAPQEQSTETTTPAAVTTTVTLEVQNSAADATTLPPMMEEAEENVQETTSDVRESTPYTVTQTVGNVAYTVTFDRSQYRPGDDISYTVRVENIGTESMTVWYSSKPGVAASAIGGRILRNGTVFVENALRDDDVMTKDNRKYEWEPGAALEWNGKLEGKSTSALSGEEETLTLVLFLCVDEKAEYAPLSVEIPFRG